MTSTAQAYEWIKTGHWSLRQFREWFDAQQRTWVGLTKNEKETLGYKSEGNTWIAVELAETKLKEKNT
jgi:hypothetical protein